MSMLRMYAVGVEEAHAIFGAEPTLAQRLRDVADERFFAAARPSRGLLDRLGPLLRQPPPIQVAGYPTADDAERLLAGHYVPPERSTAAWGLLVAWLDDLAWDALALTMSAQEFDAMEFDLARAGLSSDFTIEHILRQDAQLPLRPLPGMRVGHTRHAHVRRMAAEIDACREEASPPAVGRIDDWLGRFSGWADDAVAAGRPAPDLLAVWHP